ncbi:alpha/beta hydrolase [Amycolatopsis alkalitolerans]|nr:hypothetical protein [Amycolatopsis alkalitolerans]
MARDRRFADVEARFAPELRAAVSAETLRVAWASEMSKNGPVTTIGEPRTEPGEAGLTRVSVPVNCERGGFTFVTSVDGEGLLHGLRLAPLVTASWAPPRYAKPRRFTEREVTVGGRPGALTLPRRRRAGVVLLGPGAVDRDETTGPNKPLKDLAWGLASRGIAVVRFDNVPTAATISEEYLPYTMDAARLLRPLVHNVFLVGHSLGGKAAPRVAAADPSIAGLVILAGDTQPMHRAAVRVARYLASVDPGNEAALAAVTKQAAVVEHGLTPATPATELPFGWPASYWLDLRDYDPVATAASLGKPTLILQGGRDYQVTVADDLPRWRTLADATIRVYEADDHLFFAGEGPSTPAGYQQPQHVDPAVIADIASWIRSRESTVP